MIIKVCNTSWVKSVTAIPFLVKVEFVHTASKKA